jgi:hypothetical protein
MVYRLYTKILYTHYFLCPIFIVVVTVLSNVYIHSPVGAPRRTQCLGFKNLSSTWLQAPTIIKAGQREYMLTEKSSVYLRFIFQEQCHVTIHNYYTCIFSKLTMILSTSPTFLMCPCGMNRISTCIITNINYLNKINEAS